MSGITYTPGAFVWDSLSSVLSIRVPKESQHKSQTRSQDPLTLVSAFSAQPQKQRGKRSLERGSTSPGNEGKSRAQIH